MRSLIELGTAILDWPHQLFTGKCRKRGHIDTNVYSAYIYIPVSTNNNHKLTSNMSAAPQKICNGHINIAAIAIGLIYV